MLPTIDGRRTWSLRGPILAILLAAPLACTVDIQDYRFRSCDLERPCLEPEVCVRGQCRSADATAIPHEGLRLWLSADQGVMTEDGGVLQWNDRSGAELAALQPTSSARPTWSPDIANGGPGVRFDGLDDFLTFTLPVNGWTSMTLVLVTASAANHVPGSAGIHAAPLLWDETAEWGLVFLNPGPQSIHLRFGTGQIDNFASFGRPSSMGTALSVTMAVKDGGSESLWVDGAPVQSFAGKLSTIVGCTDFAYLGQGLMSTYFPGTIAEVLVYDRALDSAERAAVFSYLKLKYPTGE
ncbi:MAG: LamG-like jellyroll fold domain-containing protein [Myxococcota bacterium]